MQNEDIICGHLGQLTPAGELTGNLKMNCNKRGNPQAREVLIQVQHKTDCIVWFQLTASS